LQYLLSTRDIISLVESKYCKTMNLLNMNLLNWARYVPQSYVYDI